MATITSIPEPEHEEDEQRKRNQDRHEQIEEAAFPDELLNCVSETAYMTACDHLKQAGVPEDVRRLLDNFYCLMTDRITILQGKGKVTRFDNDCAMNNVADASRLIVALGGKFYTETGEIQSSAKDVSETVSRQIEGILHRAETKKSKKPKRSDG